MKRILPIVVICLFYIVARAQKKEGLMIDWPPEYKWKILKQTADSNAKELLIIPGKESMQTTSIFGMMRAYLNREPMTVAELIKHYEQSIDSGTVMTVIDSSDSESDPWLIFKVETPITVKYPIPESDLYYVRQGLYGLYEAFVALKKASFDPKEQERWVGILKNAKLSRE